MIDFDLDTTHSIVTVRPQSRLDKEDFVKLAAAVDPQIESHGDLAGLILDVKSFPGWDDFGSMVSHFRFVRDHQKHVKKVAVVTDSVLGDFAQHLASHFVSAEIKHFPADQMEEAKQWIAGES
ncbi:STAS/SEC14 domain-containing protein [Mycobacterium sp. CVI_P3]|uniref:STAS/SEC14 domain-containing protein n=1 Tax=Mycobacterium pinniadriaticum TaxID=2994102 RepID=A0ABT3SLN1_9MYCO|nr:STAS/SEC14 domain-containing protein [Mycobacterium pinniadriaticum]MCX2933975.1 STAS/SEC14 domain-containing protein [Mycobacterium pinniadriaticum]MCX2940429.1 STAS/SEC14 domain-containing protein [Mycobacterium pinniadriaticum]